MMMKKKTKNKKKENRSQNQIQKLWLVIKKTKLATRKRKILKLSIQMKE